MPNEVVIGDLVQFKLEHANRKMVWETVPNVHSGINYLAKNADYMFRTSSVFAHGNAFERYQAAMGSATNKVNMIVLGFAEACFTKSKIPALREAATKRFAQVMMFSSNPMEAPVQVWAVADELEGYDDKPYLEKLKARLRETVAQKNQ